MFKISPTTMNLIEDCPRCFWLHVVKGISRPSGPFPSLPSGVDRMLKVHFDAFMEKDELPPELKKHNVDAKLFNDKELLRKWRNNLTGIEFIDKENNVVLHGAIDNLLVKDGKLIVLDYKTRGFALKEDTAHHYKDQLTIYNYLLRKNGNETMDYAYLLFYVPEKILETGEFIFKTDLVEMKISMEHAENLYKRAISIIQGEIPEPKPKCEYCNLRKNSYD